MSFFEWPYHFILNSEFAVLRQFSIAVALPARAERTLLNYISVANIDQWRQNLESYTWWCKMTRKPHR
jgi:tRNA(His) 5'-end guanylyltransferase